MLSVPQQARIRRIIADRCPDRLKLSFALWTREAVAALSERETGLRLSRSTVSSYPRSWGCTAQRPLVSSRCQLEAWGRIAVSEDGTKSMAIRKIAGNVGHYAIVRMGIPTS